MTSEMRFALAVLASWRVSHLLASEDGPADLVVRLRRRAGSGFAGKLMDCFQCLSLWVAAPFAVFVTRKPLELFFTWLALSGGACLLERTGREPVLIRQDISGAEGDHQDGMLRSEEGNAGERPSTGAADPCVGAWT